MEEVIDLLLRYHKNKNMDEIFTASHVHNLDLKDAVEEVLSWLKLQHIREIWIKEGKRVRLKPLLLNNEDTWCSSLRRLMDKEPLFKRTFKCKKSSFDFSDEISDVDKVNARRKVYNEYNPEKKEIIICKRK